MRTSRIFWSLTCVLLSFSFRAQGKVKIVTTTTDMAWMAQRIGGERVAVESLLDGSENPHYVDVVPDFIRIAGQADLFCLIGLDLEVGWVPKVLSKSGHAKVQPGGQGYCDLSQKVAVLETHSHPSNRSMGDVHPRGNPHFWLSPLGMISAGELMLERLIAVDAENAKEYEKDFSLFSADLRTLHETLRARLREALLKAGDPKFMQYHSDFSYFINAYELKSLGSIEEKPGVPPSAGRVASISLTAKKEGVKVALALSYDPQQVLGKFSELSGAKVVVLPASLQAGGAFADYPALQRHYVDSILAALE